MKSEKRFPRRQLWLLLILLAAVFFRFYQIAESPPGLTHDEADHGITAWEIVNGARSIYFTIGYGREPLFDYAASLFMRLLGPTFLAGRLTAVMFGLLLVPTMFAWVRRAFDDNTALFSAAGIAVGFWTAMTSRQSLRSAALPTLFVLVVYFFWTGLQQSETKTIRGSLPPFVIAGVLLGATFYTYIPARILWLLFPLLLMFIGITARPLFHHIWRQSSLMLLTAAAVGSPLFAFLFNHPNAEARIGQLSAPLKAAVQGDFGPLLSNAIASLKLFTISGDPFWRYNVADRPFLQPLLGFFFYVGIAAAVWQLFKPALGIKQRIAYLTSLLWLALGIAPVLVTGPRLSTTQAIGMQPVLYLFPALGLTALGRAVKANHWLRSRRSSSALLKAATFILPLMLYGSTAVTNASAYFDTWTNSPQVRVQYETTLVAAIDYVNNNLTGDVIVSTITPHAYHSPAVAQMTLRSESASLHWFDGRNSLLLPAGSESHLIVPGFAPLSPALVPYLETAVLVETLPMRETDEDRPLLIYRIDNASLAAQWQRQFAPGEVDLSHPVEFGGKLAFLGYHMQSTPFAPGETIQLAALWRVLEPADEIILFAHLQGAGGIPIAQSDRLDVPSELWQPGAMFIQLHQLEVPTGIVNGRYPIAIGVCQRSGKECSRLIVSNGAFSSDLLPLTTITIEQ